jgi:glycosyltransferase involved in cell wall biosynthesis
MDNLPLVSIVVLCRNEEEFIGRCLDSLLANDYPKDRLEVLVADGMSQDGTRNIVESYSQKHAFVKLLDNPKKIPASAANQGIKAAKGDLVMIAGAHALYATDYVSKCAAYSQSYPAADNIGGVRSTEPRDNTAIGKSIAYVSSHRFGAGTATYHRGGTSPSWVDSVWGGCYRREVFERLGLYNEALIVGEDREFNLRLRGFGGKILQVPEIKCTYYARSKFREFCRWAFRMGFWPFYADKLVERRIVAPRNFAPLALMVSLFLSLGISMYIPVGWFLLGGILSGYLLGTVASSARLVKREGKLRYFVVTPFIFGVTHALYAIGSIYGVLKPVPAPRIET